MIKWIVILIVCVANAGCATHFIPWCRHKAVYAAIVAGEKYPVRIVRGKSTSHGWHVQAQYWDREWKWIEVDNFGNVHEGEQEGFYPVETFHVGEYYWSRFGTLVNIADYDSMIKKNKDK